MVLTGTVSIFETGYLLRCNAWLFTHFCCLGICFSGAKGAIPYRGGWILPMCDFWCLYGAVDGNDIRCVHLLRDFCVSTAVHYVLLHSDMADPAQGSKAESRWGYLGSKITNSRTTRHAREIARILKEGRTLVIGLQRCGTRKWQYFIAAYCMFMWNGGR